MCVCVCVYILKIERGLDKITEHLPTMALQCEFE